MFDSHAHLTQDACFEDIEEIAQRAKEVGVTAIINICTDAIALRRAEELKTPFLLYNAAAIHPHDVVKQPHFFDVVSEYAAKKRLVAIGETGLDYHYDFAPKEMQIDFLKKHLHLAHMHDLPVIIHCREAFEDFFSVLTKGPAVRGVLHCFTGTAEEARKGIEQGLYISFSGIVTFSKSSAIQEVVKTIALDRILVETDAPFLAPQGKRGRRNEPSYIIETVACLAQLRGIPVDEMARITTHNATQLFGCVIQSADDPMGSDQ